jgi:Na+-transporting NADH:ubiquinone oxidoreductase subunit B
MSAPEEPTQTTRSPLTQAAFYVPERLTRRAPHVRSRLDMTAVMRCVLWASLPCVAMAIYNTGLQVNRALAAGATPVEDFRLAVLAALGIGGSPASAIDCLARGTLHFVPLLIASLVAGLAAEHGSARLRGRVADHRALFVIALLFTLCLPPTMPLSKAALGSALAFTIGKEIFGGIGRNLLNPPLTGLALLYFAYPGSLTGQAAWVAVDGVSGATPLALASEAGLSGIEAAGLAWREALLGTIPGALGATSTLACAIGALVLCVTGVASWRIIAGGLVGLVAGVGLVDVLGITQPIAELPWSWHLVSGGFAFGLVFLATDPATSAATNVGRLVYGLLIGLLVVVIRVANPAHHEGVMLAILLGNVSAPLIDQVVSRVQLVLWRTRGVG